MELITFLIFTFLTLTVFFINLKIYLYLVKKGKIIDYYHPFTNKKDRNNFFDFNRIVLFIVVAILFLFGGNFYLFFAMLLFTITQFYFFKKQMQERSKEEILFTYETQNTNENSNKKINKGNKFVITNQYIYFSKRKKVLILDKPGRFLVLYKMRLTEDILEIKYGIFGVPNYKKEFTIPKKEQNNLKKVIKEIEVIKDKKIELMDFLKIKS